MKEPTKCAIVATFYKVVEYDPHPDEGSKLTWKIAEIYATSITAKQIKVVPCGATSYHTNFVPSQIGKVFYTTKSEALIAFIDRQADNINAANRHRLQAIAAERWAQTEREKLS